MLEGRCPRCGVCQIGWALQFERYQACPKCGTGLDIYRNGVLVAKGYSPFTAPEYIIDTGSRGHPAEVETVGDEDAGEK
jgi:hypothetical protein